MTELLGLISIFGLIFILTAIFNPSIFSQQQRATKPQGNRIKSVSGISNRTSYKPRKKRGYRNTHTVGNQASNQWPRRSMAVNHLRSIDLSPLTRLTHDPEVSQRLFDNEASKHPGKSATWIRDKVIFNLERDRR